MYRNVCNPSQVGIYL